MDNIQKTYHCAEVLGWVSNPQYSEYETGELAYYTAAFDYRKIEMHIWKINKRRPSNYPAISSLIKYTRQSWRGVFK
jgi:hypothetical protein